MRPSPDVRGEIIHGDSADVLKTIPTDSVDAIVCDPPAGINFMNRAFDSDRGGRAKWVAWLAGIMAEGLRVLKPGGYAFVWALPRTSHWTATALEDAGFEIRDILTHVFGSGFPKSKALMKPAAEHWILCRKPGPLRHLRIDECRVSGVPRNPGFVAPQSTGLYADKSKNAALVGYESPSGRWPANFVMSHVGGEGGCERVGTKRVAGSNGIRGASSRIYGGGKGFTAATGEAVGYASPDGTEEVPAYRCTEGCPVALMDEQSAAAGVHGRGAKVATKRGANLHTYGAIHDRPSDAPHWREPSGPASASRFFHCFEADPFIYQAKAAKNERWVACYPDCECLTVDAWDYGDQSRSAPMAPTSLGPDTSGEASQEAEDAPDSSTILSGRNTTGPSRGATKSTTRTRTSRTTESRTLNFSTPPPTSGCTPAANSGMASGGSPAASAESSSPSTGSTGTSPSRDGRFTGVVVPATAASSATACAKCGKPYRRSGHPTVKSTALMRHLCRLIAAPGDLVLDMFAGSGSTGVAALAEGMRFIGIEQDAESVETARRRMDTARYAAPDQLALGVA